MTGAAEGRPGFVAPPTTLFAPPPPGPVVQAGGGVEPVDAGHTTGRRRRGVPPLADPGLLRGRLRQEVRDHQLRADNARNPRSLAQAVNPAQSEMYAFFVFRRGRRGRRGRRVHTSERARSDKHHRTRRRARRFRSGRRQLRQPSQPLALQGLGSGRHPRPGSRRHRRGRWRRCRGGIRLDGTVDVGLRDSVGTVPAPCTSRRCCRPRVQHGAPTGRRRCENLEKRSWSKPPDLRRVTSMRCWATPDNGALCKLAAARDPASDARSAPLRAARRSSAGGGSGGVPSRDDARALGPRRGSGGGFSRSMSTGGWRSG